MLGLACMTSIDVYVDVYASIADTPYTRGAFKVLPQLSHYASIGHLSCRHTQFAISADLTQSATEGLSERGLTCTW